MKLTNTPAERLTNLLAYFGWHGGTIHQVSDITGVKAEELLYAPKPNEDPAYEWWRRGAFASETCGTEYRKQFIKPMHGNAAFWTGVADSCPARLRLKGNPGYVAPCECSPETNDTLHVDRLNPGVRYA